jgi:hypothetical protein
MNPPLKTGERNLVADRPWEEFYAGGYNSVFEEGGVYRMWYDTATFGAKGLDVRALALATSDDGIRWEKPDLGIIEFRGSTRNNLVLQEAVGTVFVDPRAAGGTRWKFAGWWNAVWKTGGAGVWIFESRDGIRWKPFRDRVLITKNPSTHHFDSQNQVFWDDRIGKYVAYVRINVGKTRKVGRAETADLDRWPEPEVVFSHDERDPVVSDHYTGCVMKYPYAPDIYLMFPSAYYHLPGKRNDGPLDIQLATSRDGIRWDRRCREPYVRLGLEGSDDGGSIYMTVGMLRKGLEIWMYYTGYDFTHGAYDPSRTRRKGVMSRLVQRLDGFVSADAAYEGGELTTVPIEFAGTHLELNVDTGALGHVRVEITDRDGRPLPGFTAGDCDPIIGNAIARRVTWRGQSDVGALARRPVRLRFAMRSTKLYAFQFGNT